MPIRQSPVDPQHLAHRAVEPCPRTPGVDGNYRPWPNGLSHGLRLFSDDWCGLRQCTSVLLRFLRYEWVESDSTVVKGTVDEVASSSELPSSGTKTRFSAARVLITLFVVLVAVALAVTVLRLTAGPSFPTPSYYVPQDQALDTYAQNAVQNVMVTIAQSIRPSDRLSFTPALLERVSKSQPGYRFQEGPVSGMNMLSVNPCADGPVCREIEVAAQFNARGTCWLGRTQLIVSTTGQLVTDPWNFGWTAHSQMCTSGTEGDAAIPQSGWKRSYPNKIPAP